MTDPPTTPGSEAEESDADLDLDLSLELGTDDTGEDDLSGEILVPPMQDDGDEDLILPPVLAGDGAAASDFAAEPPVADAVPTPETDEGEGEEIIIAKSAPDVISTRPRLKDDDSDDVIVAPSRKRRAKPEVEAAPPEPDPGEAFPPPPKKAQDLVPAEPEPRDDEQFSLDDIKDLPVDDAPAGKEPDARGKRGAGRTETPKIGKLPKIGLAVGVIAILAGAVAAAVIFLDGINKEPPPELGREPEPVKRLDQSADLATLPGGDQELLDLFTRLATESAQRFFLADRVEDLLAVARDPERVRPLMDEFYEGTALVAEECQSVELGRYETFGENEREFWLAYANMRGGEVRHVMFEQTKNGFFVDWENTVFYNPIPWEAYVNTHPESPLEFRVLCTLALDYEYPFSDRDKYVSVSLAHPLSDDSAILYGYAERDSPLGKRLIELLEDDYEVGLILKLQFPLSTGRAGRAVQILQLVSEHWPITN